MNQPFLIAVSVEDITPAAGVAFETLAGFLVTVAVFFVIYHYVRKSSGGKLMSAEDQDKASMDMISRHNRERFDDENSDHVNRLECERLGAEITINEYGRELTLEELVADETRAGRHALDRHLDDHPDDFESYYGEKPERFES